MQNEDINMLVCARVAASPRPVYGSIRANCLECAAPAWVSVSGQKAMKNDENLKPFCIECAKIKVENSEEKVESKIVPGAIDELKRHILKIGEN